MPFDGDDRTGIDGASIMVVNLKIAENKPVPLLLVAHTLQKYFVLWDNVSDCLDVVVTVESFVTNVINDESAAICTRYVVAPVMAFQFSVG
jgi:hypothetical protein